MTELVMALVVGALGVALAVGLGRAVRGSEPGTQGIRRTSDALRVASWAFTSRYLRVAGVAVGVVAVFLVVLFGAVRQAALFDATASAVELAAWTGLAFVVGAASAAAASVLALWGATGARAGALAGARFALDGGVQVALRGGAVAGLASCGVQLVGIAGFIGAVLAAAGATAGGRGAPIVARTPPMLVAWALGASLVTFIAQLGADAFAGAAAARDDANAGIARHAGDFARECVARAAEAVESMGAETVAAMTMAVALLPANVERLTTASGVLGIVLLPLVVRAFGLVASCVALFIVRTEPREAPAGALGRGLYVATLLCAIGVGGATRWTLGRYWAPFCLCGLLGVAASLALVAWGRRAWGSAVAIAVVVAASWALGAHSGLARAGRFGVAVAAMGMLASAPFLASVASFGAIARSARVAIGAEGQPASPRDRSEPLAAMGDAAAAIARPSLSGAAALVAFLCASAFLDLASAYRCSQWAELVSLPAREWSALVAQCRAAGVVPDVVSIAHPALFVAALLGATLVPVFIAQRSRAAEATARSNDAIGGGLVGTAREALRRAIVPGALFVSAPIVVGVAYDHALGLGAEGIAALVLVAIVAAVSFSPFGDRADAPPVPLKLLGAIALALAPLFL